MIQMKISVEVRTCQNPRTSRQRTYTRGDRAKAGTGQGEGRERTETGKSKARYVDPIFLYVLISDGVLMA